ncbi:DUF4226 domain-containing protein [Mycobacterium angelicum]|uniref:DUF4226 domain-containing protein n=1 Tax=Mycobacterium angelicum TaxID=470074 RepID=A0A1W9ZYX3_MYCAN|nr:DUF4226 domain-containing protein [Mycobacterium angelicum]MCV7199018.1 DUF4226 domain-containing protein [Mycobacterium angelicum]ORA22981.1 hypothetical protein BST12_08200 [Mycobacterium angelicum]
MSTYTELLAAIKTVRDATGDPNAWQAGLTPIEVTAVLTPATRSEQLDAILAKIRQHHSGLFAPAAGSAPPPPPGAPPQRQEGEAAKAIAEAEASLAHQNSASSQLDLQVISAILNAHLKTVEGREALNKLQQETEAAVRTRSDLDTPAGARDFQRFLIGKLRDIREVVANASLDDTSKSALMAAWTSLYNASKGEPGDRPAPTRPAAASARETAADPAALSDDSYLDSLLDDPGLLADGSPAPPGAPPTAAAMPGLGALPMPGAGGIPSSGWGAPGGLPLSGMGRGADGESGFPDRYDDDSKNLQPTDHEQADEPDDQKPDEPDHEPDHEEADAKPESPPAGPTTVTLPTGETVTAASPQLAAAIKAAAGGVPIAEAFQQQGIAIPAPGTPVPQPIDPSRVAPGDIGIFTERHALALGASKALLDGQIQHIAAVTGPSFLGWEHPPAAATATAPATTVAPTPTRPAATPTTW